MQNSKVTIASLNRLSPKQAQEWFSQCCASSSWCHLMTQNRPYTSLEEVVESATTHWQQCDAQDYLAAFEAHPMIGDVNSLRKKFAATKTMASNEQSGTSQADEETLQSLSKQNHAYLAKNGFIFIICATGLSAQTMLNELNKRIDNDTATEIKLAAAEQIKITILRLKKGLED